MKFDNTQKNYVILIEELSEAIQAVSKIQRFGIDNTNPVTGKKSRDVLIQELGDVIALINIIRFDLGIAQRELDEAEVRKIEKLTKYY